MLQFRVVIRLVAEPVFLFFKQFFFIFFKKPAVLYIFEKSLPSSVYDNNCLKLFLVFLLNSIKKFARTIKDRKREIPHAQCIQPVHFKIYIYIYINRVKLKRKLSFVKKTRIKNGKSLINFSSIFVNDELLYLMCFLSHFSNFYFYFTFFF